MLEGYTSLGFLAALTSTVELQLLVTGVTYRHPGLLAKIVSTLDVLSGGRAALGIGAAWYEREHAALGVPYPAAGGAVRAARGDAADRPADVERDDGPFDGTHYQLAETHQLARSRCAAAPADHDRRRRGEEDAAAGRAVRRRLQPVRRSATRPARPGRRQARRAARRTATREGTDDDRIRKTVLYAAALAPGAEAAATFAETMAAYAAVGITEVHVMPMHGDPVGFVRNLGEHVIPRVAGL